MNLVEKLGCPTLHAQGMRIQSVDVPTCVWIYARKHTLSKIRCSLISIASNPIIDFLSKPY